VFFVPHKAAPSSQPSRAPQPTPQHRLGWLFLSCGRRRPLPFRPSFFQALPTCMGKMTHNLFLCPSNLRHAFREDSLLFLSLARRPPGLFTRRARGFSGSRVLFSREQIFFLWVSELSFFLSPAYVLDDLGFEPRAVS